MGHTVNADEIGAVQSIIDSVLGGGTRPTPMFGTNR
jgi:hypothetical protein